MYQPPYAPPAPVQAPQPVAVQQEPPKKNKFGKLGSTMANSAAGGVGFGAGECLIIIPLRRIRLLTLLTLAILGAAIGSGIVNAIF